MTVWSPNRTENVFDTHKRSVVDVAVNYVREYIVPCQDQARSDCPCTKKEHEVYSLGAERIPAGDVANTLGCKDAYAEFPGLASELATDDKGAPVYGPYFFHCEEHYVTRPSLHIDNEKVTIAAHRLFRGPARIS